MLLNIFCNFFYHMCIFSLYGLPHYIKLIFSLDLLVVKTFYHFKQLCDSISIDKSIIALVEILKIKYLGHLKAMGAFQKVN